MLAISKRYRIGIKRFFGLTIRSTKSVNHMFSIQFCSKNAQFQSGTSNFVHSIFKIRNGKFRSNLEENSIFSASSAHLVWR